MAAEQKDNDKRDNTASLIEKSERERAVLQFEHSVSVDNEHLNRFCQSTSMILIHENTRSNQRL